MLSSLYYLGRNITATANNNNTCMTTATMSSKILPTVEMGELGVHHTGEPSQHEWDRVSCQLEQVLSEARCAYLTQHGIPDELINNALSSGINFFQLGMEQKMKWSQGSDFMGYVKNDDDNYSSETHDLKESFLFMPNNYNLLNKEPPPFMTSVKPLYDLVQTLSVRLLTSLSLSLGKPRDYFAKMHMNVSTNSQYRFNYYPGATKGSTDLVGFGAHVDFTTFTLLFSNGTGGLQVHDSTGQWMEVPVVPGTMLLMAGEFLSFYSNKRFKAPMHRVVLPSEEQQERSCRCSLVIFVSADEHIPMWPPIDDSSSPPPLTVNEYVSLKMGEARTSGTKY